MISVRYSCLIKDDLFCMVYQKLSHVHSLYSFIHSFIHLLSEVKVIRSRSSQGQVIPRSNCKCLTFYWQAGGGPSTERHSCFVFILFCPVETSLNLIPTQELMNVFWSCKETI